MKPYLKKHSVSRRSYLLIFLVVVIAINLLMAARDFLSAPNHPQSTPELPTIEMLNDSVVDNAKISDVEPVATIDEVENDERLPFTRLARPDHRLRGKLINHIAELTALFAQGNDAAGFKLAMNLSTCTRAAISQEELDADVEQWLGDDKEQYFIDTRVARFNFCEGVSQLEREQHLVYLNQLAESGFTPALEILGEMSDRKYMQSSQPSNLPRDQYIKIRSQFQQTKYRYLNQAAAQGSMLALQRLSWVNAHHPKLVKEQHSEQHSAVSLALANTIALLYFSENNLTYDRATLQQNKLYQIATSEEIYLAEELAPNIIELIRHSGQAYTAIKENYRSVSTAH